MSGPCPLMLTCADRLAPSTGSSYFGLVTAEGLR